MNVKLKIDSDMDVGIYSMKIEDIYLSTNTFNTLYPLETISDLSVSDFIMGDVNNNGGVDIGDAVCIVNYVVGKPNGTFLAKAADTNKNNQIDIGDAVTIVNYVVGKTLNLSRRYNVDFDEKTTSDKQ